MSLEDVFQSWGAPPGTTEKERMENAEAAVKKAIATHKQLSEMDLTVFVQGSYKANTNVKKDSDVDICVRLNSTFFYHYPAGKTRDDYGNVPGSISFIDYKNLIHNALNGYFGNKSITPGGKAFDVHENSYRVDADVLPALAYRHYFGDDANDYFNPVGAAFDTKDGKRIINWPDYAYDNGVAKQKATSQRYKKMVRIIKKLRNVMQDDKVSAADDVASFLIESMVWNVPNGLFGHDKYLDDVRAVLATCFNLTITDNDCKDLCEVNDKKYLFHPTQSWNRESVHLFFGAAWDYLGIK